MSIERGKRLVNEYGIRRSSLNFYPFFRWNKCDKVFMFEVPDMYEITILHKKEDINRCRVYITEEDLYRMINAVGYFSFTQERGNLDDQTYLGISLIQCLYYVSVTGLKKAKRSHVDMKLIARVPKGGKKPGTKIVKEVSKEELERLQYLSDNYEHIIHQCITHDWCEEYIELVKDVSKFRGEKCPPKKELINMFTRMRREYYVEK